MEKFSIEKYTPIDYRTWVLGNPAREGVNLKRLNVLTRRELKLWDAFIPYQDQRDDPGQGEWVTLHVIKLLDFVPGGIREVAVPASEGHDSGFYGYDPQFWKRLVASGGQTEGEIARRPHQNRGIGFSAMIFERIGYPPEEFRPEIYDIIGDHDTRFLPTTLSGRIVRAADYTWRVSLPCLEIYLPSMIKKEKLRQNEPWEEKYKKKSPEVLFLEASEKSALEGKPPFNLESPEYEIARLEFVNSTYFKFGEKRARRVLLPKYLPELERIAAFYKS